MYCGFILQECKHIVVTDIVRKPETDSEKTGHKHTADEKHTCVTVKFFPKLSANWEEGYNKRKSSTTFIIERDENTGERTAKV